ncbi:MAG: OmpW family outer membrane protein [Spongiibacteraceae bacterium]
MKVKHLILFASLAIPCFAEAYEKNDTIIRVGGATVAPNESTPSINVAGLATLPGAGLDSDTQLGFTLTHMISDRIGLGVLAATPFKHSISVKNSSLTAGETSHLPPTITMQFFLNDPGSAFQPYLGLGLNYTTFFKEDTSREFNQALDSIAGLPKGTLDANLKLKDSYGLAVEIGVDYQINDQWLINMSWWRIDIDTKATITTPVAVVKFDVDVDPDVYMLSVGYRF